MDQIKIGKFIAECRQKAGLNQREVADILLISSKTVSKWETGRGLPEVSLMLPLCKLLGITVNELLSGERITENLEKKAEENLVNVLKNSEQIDWKRKTLIALTAAIPTSLMLCFILFSNSNIYQMGQVPTFLTSCYLIIAFILILCTVFSVIFGFFIKKSAISALAVCLASLCLIILGIAYSEILFFLLSAIGILSSAAILIISLINKKRQ